MSRRVAFYIPRTNHLKVVAPVINHMLHNFADNFGLLILFPGWFISKRYLQPSSGDFEQLFERTVKLEVLDDPSEFVNCLKKNSVDAVVCVGPRVADIDSPYDKKIIAEAQQLGIKWVSLPHTFESEFLTVSDPETVIKYWDMVCVVGRKSVDFVESKLNIISSDMVRPVLNKMVITGYPEFDGINNFKSQVICEKYGLPVNKPKVFISTAPMFYRGISGNSPIKSLIGAGLNARFRGFAESSKGSIAGFPFSLKYPVCISYRQYLSKLRHFADQNNACLVAKTRGKHEDPECLGDYMDHIFADVSYFPFTTLELLSVSALYFGFYSAAAIEALVSGLYAVTALFSPINVVSASAFDQEYTKSFFAGSGNLWNTRGVSHVIHGTKLSGRNALKRFSCSSLDDYKVDEEQRQQLLGRFISYIGNSSERFVDALQSLW